MKNTQKNRPTPTVLFFTNTSLPLCHLFLLTGRHTLRTWWTQSCRDTKLWQIEYRAGSQNSRENYYAMFCQVHKWIIENMSILQLVISWICKLGPNDSKAHRNKVVKWVHASLFYVQLEALEMLLKVDCLPNAVGKQPSIPLINLERKLSWWWWWASAATTGNWDQLGRETDNCW